MNQNQQPSTSYDLVPYTSHTYHHSHPDRLATIATLFGMTPQPVEKCRVLELGCASGGNIIPMADQFPESDFLGIDSSTVQIGRGQQTIAQVGLSNVRLECRNIMDFPLTGKPFDYIICHGVYSWVPNPVQERIFDICGTCLSENGVAFVSYNTFPGWHLRSMIRDIMLYRAKSFDSPEQRLAQAKGLLAFLTSAVQGDESPYSNLLSKELENINRAEEAYLHHEHLEEFNQPCYFFEFVSKAQEKGLQYLGDSDFGSMSVTSLPEKTRAMLQGVSRDLIELEQYKDFLRNRGFRETLLCRNSVPLERKISARSIMRLKLASSATLGEKANGSGSSGESTFSRNQSSMRTNDPLVRAAFIELAKCWPRAIAFPELASIAKSAVSGHHGVVDSGVLSTTNERLAETMIRCFESPILDLHTVQPKFALEETEFPRASTISRHLARSSTKVVNLQHFSIGLDDFERQVLILLDGQHSKQDIAEQLVAVILRGDLIVYHQKVRVTAADAAKQFVDGHLESSLSKLRQRALIVE